MATFLSHLYSQSKLMCAATTVHVYVLPERIRENKYMQTLKFFFANTNSKQTFLIDFKKKKTKKFFLFSFFMLLFLSLLSLSLLWCHGLYFHSSSIYYLKNGTLYDTLELQAVSVTATTKPSSIRACFWKRKVSLIFINVSRKKWVIYLNSSYVWCSLIAWWWFLCSVCVNSTVFL